MLDIEAIPPHYIDVALRPAGSPRHAALVAIRGEHDMASSGELEMVLAPLHGNVLIDLTECTFLDSTIIGVILAKARELRREGHELEVVTPPNDSIVVRALRIVGFDQIVVVHDASPPRGSRP